MWNRIIPGVRLPGKGGIMIRALLVAGVLLTGLFGTQGHAAETVEGCLEKYGNDEVKRLRCYDDIARQRQKISTPSPTTAPPPAQAPQHELRATAPAAADAAEDLDECKKSNAGYNADNNAARLRCYDDRAKYSWSMCVRGSPAWESPGRINACKYFFEDTERLNGYDKITGFTPQVEPYRPSYLSLKWRLDEESRLLDEKRRQERYVESLLALEKEISPLDEKSPQLEKKRQELNEKNREAIEEKSRQDRLSLAYRQNYILLYTNNFHANNQLWESANPGKQLEDYELKYQLSLKLRLFELTDNWVTRLTGVDWERHLGMHIDVWLAYTQLSFWQVYNASISRPFRETNYEPELILNGRMDKELFDGWKLRFIQIVPVDHQSNGQSQPLSRSWNRSMLNFGFERGDFDVVLKTWYRWPESAENDDNPDIESYLGYGELSAGYIFRNVVSDRDLRLGLMFRNNLRFDGQNRSALQLGVDFSVGGPLNLYVQYFTGYGESLIGYNSYANSIGAGISVKDW